MQLTSPNFIHNSSIPSKFTCDGQDISPELQIIDVPLAAKSLALIVDDPDAPNGDWVHWLLWNINPKIGSIKSNQIPTGAVQGLNNFKRQNYGGPCPPSGKHHYHFKLYALDKPINLSTQSKKSDLESAMQGHVIDKAELIGLYQRL